MLGVVLHYHQRPIKYKDPSKGHKTFFTTSKNIFGYITQEIIDEYKELYEANKNNKLEPNKNIYLTPLSEYASFKLKNYIEENNLNIKLTRKIPELDSFIINHNFISESYLHPPNLWYKIPINIFYQNPIFKKYIPSGDDYWLFNHETIKAASYVFISPTTRDELISIDSNFSIIDNYPLINHYLVSDDWGKSKTIKNVDFFINLFKKIKTHNINLIFDKQIDKDINKELTIDEDIFENIINMINNTDHSTIQIAKEILTNMEYESSKPYLIYLYNYFYFLRQHNNKGATKLLYKNIKKHIHIFYTKNYEVKFETFLPTIITQYPYYSQIFMNCFRIHMNILLKHPCIEEIKTY
jgi:hypothetical protein